ncbi:tumor necrosis factor receptor superfamily member 13B [Nothobranchius furzeri]|uniref:TNFR-Cys domain-containing protein n=2 Tax=Nothobranchius furzeri TaxID=105023 RepID=A0A8C6MAQ2_NOTFU
MEDRCRGGSYLDALIKLCVPCWKVCQEQQVFPKCVSYCDSARCMAKPGHYFDRLVKKCVRCAEVCGKHPAQCSQHCTTPPPVTTKRLLAGVTKQMGNTRTPSEPIPVPFYPLLALCMALLFSSLCLALVVFLRGGKTKTTRTTRVHDHGQKCAVQSEQEFGCPTSRAGRSSEDPTCLSYLACREPSDDSIPIETCACVRCFPDLRVLGQDNDTLKKITLWIYVILLCTSVPHDYNEFNQ